MDALSYMWWLCRQNGIWVCTSTYSYTRNWNVMSTERDAVCSAGTKQRESASNAP